MSKIHQAIRRAEREGRAGTAPRQPEQQEPKSPARPGVASSLTPPRDGGGSARRPSPPDPFFPEMGRWGTETRPIFRQPAELGLDREESLQQSHSPGIAETVGKEVNVSSLVEKRTLSLAPNPKLVSWLAPKSVASEQYRSLKAKIFQMRGTQRLKTLLVTSATASEGKTLSSINLALTIAQEIDQKILLIDTDLRRPSVHKVLGIPAEKGLSALLCNLLSPDEAILQTEIPNLCVTVAGSIPQNPAELLNTQHMRNFLSFASERFDWVILDSPPLVPLADSEFLSSAVDGILLVVRAHHAPASMVIKSAETLKGKNVLGVIFNCSDQVTSSSYYYYYGSVEPDADKMAQE